MPIVVFLHSRGRSASLPLDFEVEDYSPPSLTRLSAQRCSADGTEAQMDGTNIRFTTAGSVSPVNNKSAISCLVYYRPTTTTAWQLTDSIGASNYAVSATNRLLSPTFDVLTSYSGGKYNARLYD